MQTLKKIGGNKKGFAVEIIALIVVGFVSLVFFALWIYGMNLVNTELLAVPSDGTIGNVSEAAENSFSWMNTGLDSLKMIGFVIILGYSIATLIVAYYSKDHPIMLVMYILLTVILVVFSIYISNAFEDLLSDPVLGTTLSSFSIGKHIMLNLPIWISVVGFLGVLLMLVGRVVGGQEY